MIELAAMAGQFAARYGGAMGNERKSAGPSLAALVLALSFIVKPILYVLSIGPAIWLSKRGHLDPKTVDPSYAPLQWCYENSRPVKVALDQYIELWEPGE